MQKMIQISQKERVMLKNLENESVGMIVLKANLGMKFDRKIMFSRSSKSEEKLDKNDQFF